MRRVGREHDVRIYMLSYDGFHTDGRGFIRTLKEMASLAKVYKVKAVSLRTSDELPSKEFYQGVQIGRISPAFGFDRILQRELQKQNLLGSMKRLYTLTIKNTLASGLALLTAAWKENADVYHCFGIYSLIPGFFLKLLRGKNVIYDPVEPVPYKVAAIASLGRFAKPLSKITEVMENFMASRMDCILVTPSANNEYYRRFRKYSRKVTILKNVPSLDWKPTNHPEFLGDYAGHKILVYAGALVKAKGLFTMIRVFSAVHTVFSDVKLILVGSFEGLESHHNAKRKTMDYVQKHDLQDSIIITGFIPWPEIPNYLAAADVALHLYQPLPGITENVGTSSLFEYMSASLPIVASDFPAYEAVKRYNCGITVDPTNEQEIASAVLKLLNDSQLAEEMGRNARKAFEQEFNWELEERKLLQVYSELGNK